MSIGKQFPTFRTSILPSPSGPQTVKEGCLFSFTSACLREVIKVVDANDNVTLMMPNKVYVIVGQYDLKSVTAQLLMKVSRIEIKRNPTSFGTEIGTQTDRQTDRQT
jgi:hypothetical protein